MPHNPMLAIRPCYNLLPNQNFNIHTPYHRVSLNALIMEKKKPDDDNDLVQYDN